MSVFLRGLSELTAEAGPLETLQKDHGCLSPRTVSQAIREQW